MKIAVFNTKKYDIQYFKEGNAQFNHDLVFFEPHLDKYTSNLAEGFDAVCPFVNDTLDAAAIANLHELGIRLIALRCAGFNNVDLEAAERCSITVCRVPAYSPYGVAEHTISLMLALNRKIHRAHNRIHEGNFSLMGLMGFEMREKTAGVIGTGKIGQNVVRILHGFGCNIIAYDPFPNEYCKKLGARYVSLDEIFQNSDIISLHVPLIHETYHLINENTIHKMKNGVMLINTSRGGLINTPHILEGLKSGKIGYLGLDVYEEEGHLFFEDLSDVVLQDDVFARLLTFPNVIITGHQAFFTETAVRNIVETTLSNATHFTSGTIPKENIVSIEHRKKTHSTR